MEQGKYEEKIKKLEVEVEKNRSEAQSYLDEKTDRLTFDVAAFYEKLSNGMNKNIETVEERLTSLIENSKMAPIQEKYQKLKKEMNSVKNGIRQNDDLITTLKVLGYLY